MEWTAAIVAKQQQQFTDIVETLEKTGLNMRYHHCPDSDTLDQLLLLHHMDVILYAQEPAQAPRPHRDIARILLIADRKGCPVCFISNTEEPAQAGLIPVDSIYLNLGQDPQEIQNRLVHAVSSYSPPAAQSLKVPLSSHPNRGSVYTETTFKQLLEHELAHSTLTGHPLSILLIAPAGDNTSQLWQELSISVGSQIRSSDLLCHVPGRGLLLLLPATPQQLAEKLAVRIHSQHSELPGYKTAQFAVTLLEGHQLLASFSKDNNSSS